jgi:hypothetical protein
MKDKLAIIVPYRDRQDHLDVFVPHMREFLKDKDIEYDIFIIEQSDDRPFNYGKLCNAAVKEISEEYTYFAFHDIDMLPISDECDYSWPEVPTHLATNVESHDNKLPYPQYFGGVVLINREDFEDVNGYSNEYYGYGFEDLDLLYRIERAGLPLETFYDKNKTYSNYDELDILPYRIENVNLSRNPFLQKIKVGKFGKSDYLYASLNPLGKTIPTKSFSISFWFNDRYERESIKNLFCFEGYDSGLFLNNGNQIIGQIWNDNEEYTQVVSNYSRNVWNHIIFEFNVKDNIISINLNNKKVADKILSDNFNIFDYTNKHIKISDDKSEIDLSEIFVFDSILSDESKSELYFKGSESLNDLKTRFGIEPVIYFDYTKSYSRNLLLDKGSFLNHSTIKGNLNIIDESIELADKIYIPLRLEGEYKSLVHDNDTDIIKRYYTYDPDITENSDIFFHEVLTGELDYKTIGLSNIQYTLLDKLKRDGYELVRIVT